MSKLRKQLKAQAEKKLNDMIISGKAALSNIVGSIGITEPELAKLIIGGRTQSTEIRAISRMVAKAEDELVSLYNKQEKLELDGK